MTPVRFVSDVAPNRLITTLPHPCGNSVTASRGVRRNADNTRCQSYRGLSQQVGGRDDCRIDHIR